MDNPEPDPAARCHFSLAVPADHPDYAALSTFLRPEDHPGDDGFGIVLMETATQQPLAYITSLPGLDHFHAQRQREGNLVPDTSAGVLYTAWPRAAAWKPLIPMTTWHPDGEGIIAELTRITDTATKVVVIYEYVVHAYGRRFPAVAYHCQLCHWGDDTVEYPRHNEYPRDRKLVRADAETHLRATCTTPQPSPIQTTPGTMHGIYSHNHPAVSLPSRCAAVGGCARIRHLRAKSTN
ncbi:MULTISPECIES: hypothetical protein [unclassified Nocardia]|uniref:hypothetical protein n=1 Tax=unclassified Nocardia TaxID=2637762 RepID=UPI001CE3DA43|nr:MULTISPECIES: hypothetical protein [unclassified Nocardia]